MILRLFTGPSPPGRGDTLVPGRRVPLINPARRGLHFFLFFSFLIFLFEVLYREMICCQGVTDELGIPGRRQRRGTGDPRARGRRRPSRRPPATSSARLVWSRRDRLFVSQVKKAGGVDADLIPDLSEVK